MPETTARLIDGKAIASEIEAEIRDRLAQDFLPEAPRPCLTVIQVGDHPASSIYVRNKGRACERVGFASFILHLPSETTEEALLAEVARLNSDPLVHGILVQLPLPRGINERRVLEAIAPLKDVDGFHPYNAGRLAQGHPTMVPATPSGILELLQRSSCQLLGAEAVVIGRSAIVGRPMAALLTMHDATVTLCHSQTRSLGQIIKRADIVIAAMGRANYIKAEMIKPGATVIDVGMNRNDDGKLVGDVDFAEVAKVAGSITPVPGGVGPMTIAMLLHNTLKAYRKLQD